MMHLGKVVAAVAAIWLIVGLSGMSSARALHERVPAPRTTIPNDRSTEVAIFAGGCFWGVEAVFEELEGVKSAVSGFSGGSSPTVTYQQVIRGGTGHAEAVRVTFDPRVISYGELMQVYFSVIADPTQLNRQGPDVGRHYRGAFFPIDDRQASQARAYIAQLDRAKIWDKPIVTAIEPYRHFVTAEAYHQDFARKNPFHPYIMQHDAPKVRAVKELFPDMVG
ncbi:peptide-methionine (S)-S-oxide reductase MsrA [Sphingomicrobium sediminis]|uniref:Peptide methionine sulfoxide reductase MsrA n=1 Tax=Sphingomicrobium sediminis TaxID=2950949 RepID=A0A9X2EHH1_9SPHN|nr:peptide-methionine (S)-S-oxide reductase MsrA [Sphingomicrobium sediminis]MCM8556771.1 peptide-methionine (S)-S-oxide reductase MsrA [Sphingomicrobium sediminis]